MTNESFAFTHPGHERKNNEDSFLVNDKQGFWVVCDGMGGHEGGSFASHLVTDILQNIQLSGNFEQKVNTITAQIYNIHKILQKKVQKFNKNSIIGTTLVMIFVQKDQAVCIHAGDSRCYIFRNNTLFLATKDHAKMVKHDNKNQKVLTKAIFAPGKLSIEMKRFNVKINDTFFLCTDGIYEYLNSSYIKSSMKEQNLQKSMQKITQKILSGKARDNLTGILVRINE